MISIGLDVGGTKVLGVAVDSRDPATVLVEERVATPDGGTGLVDTLLSPPQFMPNLTILPSVDGNELVVTASGNNTGAVRKDKTVLPLTSVSLTFFQFATYSPYGGLYLPDWAVFSSTLAGVTGTRWKKFGGATGDGLHTIANNLPVSVAADRSRFTADRAQFLFNGTSGSDLYLMAIDGPGKAALKVPVE